MTATFFPDNILDVIEEKGAALTGVEAVVRRVIEPTDPNGCMALVADEWHPEDAEIGGFDATTGYYSILVMHLVKNTNADEGNMTHRSVAKAVRLMLARDPALRVAFGGLRETDPPHVERVLKWEVASQRFGSSEIAGSFTFLSVTELHVHTEIV